MWEKRVVVETKGPHKRRAPGICKNNNHHHFPFTFTALWSRAFNLFSPFSPIYPSSTTLYNCTPASKLLLPYLPFYPHPRFLNVFGFSSNLILQANNFWFTSLKLCVNCSYTLKKTLYGIGIETKSNF